MDQAVSCIKIPRGIVIDQVHSTRTILFTNVAQHCGAFKNGKQKT